MTKKNMNKELEFLYESNMIEGEMSGLALLDAHMAWEHICSLKKKKLSVDDIMMTHYYLMKSLNPRIAGVRRKVPVYIGGREAVNAGQIGRLLMQLTENKPKTWAEIKKWHIDYEGIHPFEDGNGRTGRIIMNWHRKINKLPILVIHHGSEKWDYYDWFK